jgi:peptidoglycan/LPS O-acetylase OafA/YrhL
MTKSANGVGAIDAGHASPDAIARENPPSAHVRGDAYRRDIDGLRAIAVLAVVVFHAFPERLPGGYVGVDVFFVISGYLISGVICGQLARGRFSFADFYARRIRRILPALIVVLAACFAFGWITLLPDEYKQLGKHIAAGMGFVSNFALWNEAGYFDASASSKPLLHLWSLGIEEQFYLIWPLALWLFARMRRSAFVLVVAVGVASFAINLATVHLSPVAAFYSPLSRFWELQLGCLLALLMHNWEPRRNPMPRKIADSLSTAGAVALGLSIALFNTDLAFPGAWALLPTVGTFLLIASGPDGWFSRRVLSRNVLVGIGLISYPLYLWHWPILSFASIIEIGTPPEWVRVAAALASGVLALATYLFVEKPIRFGAPRSFKVPALVVSSVLVGVIGYVAYARSGLPARFPPEVQAIANFQYEFKTDARYPDCWLSAKQPFDGFAPFCTGTAADSELAVVWGDSHAARLYPGLKTVLGDKVALSQFTRDACPPLLGVAAPNCIESNAWVLAQIARMRPHTVILFAAWTHYQVDWQRPSASKAALAATIAELQKAGVGNIVVIGPAPVWKGGLPKLMYQAWTEARPFHVIPERLTVGLDPNVFAADRALRLDVPQQRVTYVSATDVFCTSAGCLTHVPDGAAKLVTWDSGHLTTDGAALVARRLVADGVLQ